MFHLSILNKHMAINERVKKLCGAQAIKDDIRNEKGLTVKDLERMVKEEEFRK